MAKKMPPAGRPGKTPAARVPPRMPGVTGGKVRSRTDADKPYNPVSKPVPAVPQGKRKAR
jgi:hypothetical protein